MNVEAREKFVNGEGVNNDFQLKGSDRIYHHPNVLARNPAGDLRRSRFSSPRRLRQREIGEFPEESTGTPPWVKSLQKLQSASDFVSSKSKREKLTSEPFFLPWTDERVDEKLNKGFNKIKIEPPGPFIGDAFSFIDNEGCNGETDKSKNPTDKTTNDTSKKLMRKSVISKKKANTGTGTDKKSLKKPTKVSTKKRSESAQSDLFVVNWCRTSHFKPPKLFVAESLSNPECEATSTTSATSRSKDIYETLNTPKHLKQVVTKSPRTKTGFNLPKTKKKKDVAHPMIGTAGTFNIFREFDFPDDKLAKRDPATSDLRNENSMTRITASNRKLSKTCSRAKDTKPTNRIGSVDACMISWTRDNSVSPIKIKPKLSMTINSPTKKKVKDKNLDVKKNKGNFEKENSKVVKMLANEKLSRFGEASNTATFKRSFGKNSEPLDFSEFDSEDFSYGDYSADFSDPSLLSVKPILPLYGTVNNDIPFEKSYFQISDDIEENMWLSPFSYNAKNNHF